ncbi:YCF48-related protein [Haliscomenobacter sp.]|uniref:WD40/YVTN/BNR-like repeat-containing protein n=1 Tax=Haliscomenobacter sp. TaxID=2717303 RepID=UPI003364DB9C
MPLKTSYLLLLLSCLLNLSARCQTIQILSAGTKTSLRGLSAVDDQTIWVSGSAGTVGKSTDGGQNWQWMNVQGFEKTDFRDIEAFDAQTAIVMGVASPAYILKTTDGGQTWKKLYENRDTSMFMDAMDFFDAQNGMVIGDPLQGKVFIAKTQDAGNTWQTLSDKEQPTAATGEAFFASSGTNIRMFSKNGFVFASGGKKSSLFMPGLKKDLPLIQGKETTGANSIAIKGKKILIVMGGDFMTKDATTDNCFVSTNGGMTFAAPLVGPHGYRSCVEYLKGKNWIACGLNGVDYSTDEGKNWSWISKESFHVCRKAKKGNAVYFAGGGGRIGKLILN